MTSKRERTIFQYTIYVFNPNYKINLYELYNQVEKQDDDDDVCFVLADSSLKQQFAGRHIAPLLTNYLDCEPTSV